jgi:hypothetical protein
VTSHRSSTKPIGTVNTTRRSASRDQQIRTARDPVRLTTTSRQTT